MAKKKSQFKKHSFSHDHLMTAPTVTTKPAATKPTQRAQSASANDVISTSNSEFDYVKRDLRRVILLGGSFIILLFIVWWVFSNTGVGSIVYGWAGA